MKPGACAGWLALWVGVLCCLPAAAAADGATTPADAAALERCVHGVAAEQRVPCLDALRDHAERELDALNAAIRRNLSRLGAQGGTPMADVHQAWTTLRDADCALARDYAGQPGHALPPDAAWSWCMAEHTLNRVAWVEAHLRRPTASAAESERIRSVRTEALRHRQALAAARAAGVEPPAGHQCRYESAISTPPPDRLVALTFDDGPEEGETAFILDTLARHEVRAAFFLIGEKARQHPELVARLVAAGHLVVGNHSWSHPNFHDISPEVQVAEVARGDAELRERLGGEPSPLLFRYPYGNSSCAANDYLHGQGYRIVGWHVDSCDWAFDQSGSVSEADARICEVGPAFLHDFVGHVLSQVERHHGGIVLMHEIHPHTLHHLDELITRLQAQGYQFGALDDPRFAASLR